MPTRPTSSRPTAPLGLGGENAPPTSERQVRSVFGDSGSTRRRSAFSGPLLNTIDRYVLGQFLRNYVLTLGVLLALYVVLDMVVKFDEFIEVTGTSGVEDMTGVVQVIGAIFDYYFYQSFRIFSLLAGVIPVIAAAFTLMRMSRFNELAALLAAGVPLLRVAQPIILASLVLNLVLLPINQELIVPSIMDQLTRERGATDALGAGMPLQAMQDGPSGVVFVGAYFPPFEQRPASMYVLDVLIRDGERLFRLSADRAVWDASQQAWRLENGVEVPVGQLAADGSQGKAVGLYAGTVTPESIGLFISRGDFVDLLSTTRINQLIEMANPVGMIDLLRVRDARLAGFVLNIVLVLLTIPCVLTREPMLLRTGAGRVFVLVGSCMGMVFVCQTIAGQMPSGLDPAIWLTKWPALMAWVPIFVFGPIAVWMLARIRS